MSGTPRAVVAYVDHGDGRARWEVLSPCHEAPVLVTATGSPACSECMRALPAIYARPYASLAEGLEGLVEDPETVAARVAEQERTAEAMYLAARRRLMLDAVGAAGTLALALEELDGALDDEELGDELRRRLDKLRGLLGWPMAEREATT